jgi:riboflavin kinase
MAPYPGTLNLRLTAAFALTSWQRIRTTWPGRRLRSPDPAFCDATCFPVLVNGKARGAVVLPHVEGYPADVLEILAAERLRDALGLVDGDEVFVTFEEPVP